MMLDSLLRTQLKNFDSLFWGFFGAVFVCFGFFT